MSKAATVKILQDATPMNPVVIIIYVALHTYIQLTVLAASACAHVIESQCLVPCHYF
jgi:hypothetical protein